MAGVALVTGATSGIGYATARELARAGWQVLLCGRDRSSADAAADRLRSEARAIDVNAVHCDHSRLADVSDLADRITEVTRNDKGLAAIILAAAVANPPGRRTVDGLDTTLTVNHLTPYLLRERLGPVLAATGGRVVLIGSSQHTLVKAADLDPAIFASERASAVQRNEVTKLLTLLTLQAHQLAANPPLHLGVDPGFVRTNLGRSASGRFRVLLNITRPIQAPPERPARLIRRVLEDSSLPNGAYLDEKGLARRSALALSDEAARRWEAWTRAALHPWLTDSCAAERSAYDSGLGEARHIPASFSTTLHDPTCR
jgi:NAD(P)-dependent dehydrogenase (short-subunit alcohol dehydrogenase family)